MLFDVASAHVLSLGTMILGTYPTCMA